MKKRRKNNKVLQPTKELAKNINCNNENATNLLIDRTMQILFKKKFFNTEQWTDDDYASVSALIEGINPRDMVEATLAAQFIGLHLKSMNMIAEDNYHNVMKHALIMVKLSQQALHTLQQYRGNGQTINVNYSVLNNGDTVMNNLFQGGDDKKNEDKS